MELKGFEGPKPEGLEVKVRDKSDAKALLCVLKEEILIKSSPLPN